MLAIKIKKLQFFTFQKKLLVKMANLKLKWSYYFKMMNQKELRGFGWKAGFLVVKELN